MLLLSHSLTDWITGVYWPERARKVPGTRIKHTMEMGNRYVVHFEKANRVHVEVTMTSHFNPFSHRFCEIHQSACRRLCVCVFMCKLLNKVS